MFAQAFFAVCRDCSRERGLLRYRTGLLNWPYLYRSLLLLPHGSSDEAARLAYLLTRCSSMQAVLRNFALASLRRWLRSSTLQENRCWLLVKRSGLSVMSPWVCCLGPKAFGELFPLSRKLLRM